MNRAEAEQLIRDCFAAALRAADPEAAVRRSLILWDDALVVNGRAIPLTGRLIVVGVGKAAVPMALGAEAVCGDRIAGGLVITKDGHASGALPRRIGVAEAAHPIPDERGVRATREMLEQLSGLDDSDVVLALISGGGSALLEAPRPPVTLDDLARTTDLLLRAGAPIQDLNRVRRPLSLVKGGGLRRAAGGATMATLILSDVLGNDPQIIASGPTVFGRVSTSKALELLDQYGVRDRAPATVISALESSSGAPSDWPFADDVFEIVADNATAVAAAKSCAKARGLTVETAWTAVDGEAANLGRNWTTICRVADPHIDLILGGGEATVTVQGNGVGGRNTEFALAAALRLEKHRVDDWIVASLATDGQDGPTGVAGAIADVGTCARAREAGVDPDAALRENDSLAVFEAAGGIVAPGPTGTNVNDLYFAVRVQED